MKTNVEACVTAFISIDFMKRIILKVLIKSTKTGIDSSFGFVIESTFKAFENFRSLIVLVELANLKSLDNHEN